MANTIKVKRGNKASMPALAAGEIAFASDKGLFYVGTNGTKAGNTIVGRKAVLLASESAWTALGSSRDNDTFYYWP